LIFGDRGGTVFKVLCYKLEGRWFDPSWFQLNLGTAAAQWLRCCATNQKVAGSIPAGVIGFLGIAVAQCLRRCATNRKVAGSIPAGVRGFLGTALAQCLRRCATNRKVAGSIPDGIVGSFH
jgi:hypothetical protein